jgi:hypothetical protein
MPTSEEKEPPLPSSPRPMRLGKYKTGQEIRQEIEKILFFIPPQMYRDVLVVLALLLDCADCSLLIVLTVPFASSFLPCLLIVSTRQFYLTDGDIHNRQPENSRQTR